MIITMELVHMVAKMVSMVTNVTSCVMTRVQIENVIGLAVSVSVV